MNTFLRCLAPRVSSNNNVIWGTAFGITCGGTHWRKAMKCTRLFLLILPALILFLMVTVLPATSEEIIVQSVKPEKGANFQQCIRLTVSGLDSLLAEAKKANKKIIPFVNGFPLKGLQTEQVNENTLSFFLKRTPKSKDAWRAMLSMRKHYSQLQDVSLSVGLEGGTPKKTMVDKYVIEVIDPFNFKLSLLGAFIFSVFLIVLSNKSEILRNPTPKPAGGKKRTYSLALSQMAVWFGVIVYAFVIIWVATGELSTLTDSVLWLMGISAGTFLGAAAIDKSKLIETQSKKGTLAAEKKALDEKLITLRADLNKLKNLSSPTPNTNSDIISYTTQISTAETRLGEVETELAKLPATDDGPPSKNWLIDVLTDINGISLHRFQILIWTIVLVSIFLFEVWKYLAMPEFSTTLLGLMGISSGTYIGFKFPEQNPQPTK